MARAGLGIAHAPDLGGARMTAATGEAALEPATMCAGAAAAPALEV